MLDEKAVYDVKRMQSPGSFALDELLFFCRSKKIAIEELRDAIRK